MEPKVDGGPIAYETRFPLDGTETGFSLNARCIREGVPLVRRLVEAVAAGEPVPSRVQEGRRHYFGRRPPQDGRIGWRRPAASVDRLVRSLDFSPFPARLGEPRVVCEDRQLTVTRVARTGRSVGEAPPGRIRREGDRVQVACADEWIELVRVCRDGTACAPSEGLAGLDRLPAEAG
jgi:methionyl-tRNA formyltransferase